MNIFEELMAKHQEFSDESLVESVQKKSMTTRAKKIDYRKIKVESLRIFENASDEDIEEIDKQFDTEVKDDEETDEDEVVLIIDPELPSDEEVPEDAAQDLVGDYVYKCPVCGANYVCNCDADMNESVEVDEEGVPVECPVCGDDSDQILIGQIAPADEVKDEDEGEMEPVDVDDAEDNEEDIEEFEEDEDKVIEDSLKRRPLPRRRIKTESKKSSDINDYVDTYSEYVLKKYSPQGIPSWSAVTRDIRSQLARERLTDEEVNQILTQIKDIVKNRAHLKIQKESKKPDVCPECGKDPCECDKKDEGCGKKSRKKKVKESKFGYEDWVEDLNIDGFNMDIEDEGEEDGLEYKYVTYLYRGDIPVVTVKVTEDPRGPVTDVDPQGNPFNYKASYSSFDDFVKDLKADVREAGFESKKPLRKKVKESFIDGYEEDDIYPYIKKIKEAGCKIIKSPYGMTSGGPHDEPLYAVSGDEEDLRYLYSEDHGPFDKRYLSDLEESKKPLRKKVKEDIEDDEEVDVNLDLDAPAPEIPPIEKEAPKVAVNADKVEIVLDDVRFNKLMNKMIRENYKGSPQFKLTKITSKDQKLTLEYNVAKVKGKFVAEGFSRNARVMKLRMRDQGAFTESFTKVPSFVVECVRIRNKIVPTKVSYNFTKKVNESLYRVRGEIKNSK